MPINCGEMLGISSLRGHEECLQLLLLVNVVECFTSQPRIVINPKLSNMELAVIYQQADIGL